MKTWIVVGNPHPTETAKVEVWIHGIKKETKDILPNGRWTPYYDGLNDGPVRVVSIPNGKGITVDILASERTTYKQSVSEIMGYPKDDFDTEFWLPWYDRLWMKTWIVVANPHPTEKAKVEIWIHGIKKETTEIPANGRITPYYDGLNDGPVRIVSVPNTNGITVDILASERITYKDSVSETMAYPAGLLTTEYWFPWYERVAPMYSWIVVGNPHPTEVAKVEIYIHGVKKETTDIPANGGRITPIYNGVADGPVRIVSIPNTNGITVDVFASQRVTYTGSVTEMMGYPNSRLTSEYWFPWYDNYWMSTALLISKP